MCSSYLISICDLCCGYDYKAVLVDYCCMGIISSYCCLLLLIYCCYSCCWWLTLALDGLFHAFLFWNWELQSYGLCDLANEYNLVVCLSNCVSPGLCVHWFVLWWAWYCCYVGDASSVGGVVSFMHFSISLFESPCDLFVPKCSRSPKLLFVWLRDPNDEGTQLMHKIHKLVLLQQLPL